MNEQHKYEVIKKLVDTNGNKARAALTLNCSLRQVNRLIKKYKEEGKSGFVHGNRGRRPACTLSPQLRKDILCLYTTKYENSNLRHFTELLAEHEGIKVSETTVRNILFEQGILSPKARRDTRKTLKKQLKQQQKEAKTKKEILTIQEKIDTVENPHKRRPRCAYFGEMLQMDASPHQWFSGITTYLHAAIDDATGTVVAAYFDKQETLNGYYQIFKQVLENYGIPYMFYTDRRTVFEYKKLADKEKKIEKNTLTQFGYACKQLGVELKVTSVPQAKGRVERLFETLQSRLPIELRLAGVTTIEQANEFLHSYLDKFNKQFALPTNSIKSVFVTQPSSEKINLILAVLAERKIDAGHCVRYNNNYYKLVDKQGMDACYRKGMSVMIIKALDGALYASVADEIFQLEKLQEHEKVSRYFSTKSQLEEAKKTKPRYIPDMSHPWKKDNFMKYVHSMLGREEYWIA
jgi:transposase